MTSGDAVNYEEIRLFFSLVIEEFYETKRLEEIRKEEQRSRELKQTDEGANIHSLTTVEMAIPDKGEFDKGNAKLLLDDMINLFNLGDLDGGLISFERLLILYRDHAKMGRFIKKYRDRLLKVYRDIFDASRFNIGLNEKIFKLFSFYEENARVRETLELVKTHKGELKAMIDEDPSSELQLLASINLLVRPGILTLFSK